MDPPEELGISEYAGAELHPVGTCRPDCPGAPDVMDATDRDERHVRDAGASDRRVETRHEPERDRGDRGSDQVVARSQSRHAAAEHQGAGATTHRGPGGGHGIGALSAELGQEEQIPRQLLTGRCEELEARLRFDLPGIQQLRLGQPSDRGARRCSGCGQVNLHADH